MATNPIDLMPAPRLASINSLRRQIDGAFSEFTPCLGFTPLSLDKADYQFHPSADLHDDGSITTIRVELPGISPKDVTVEVVDDTLEVSGEKKTETETRTATGIARSAVSAPFIGPSRFPFRSTPTKWTQPLTRAC